MTGAGLIVYFREEKARMERKRTAEATKGIGKPKVGGAFELLDHHGKRFTSDDMKGKYALVGLSPLREQDRRHSEKAWTSLRY